MKARSQFIRSENIRLGKFLDVDHLVGWRRSYRCDCGFSCYAPGDIWDHETVCQTARAATPAKTVEL